MDRAAGSWVSPSSVFKGQDYGNNKRTNTRVGG